MFPAEASYLYDWTHTSKMSYGDFLRAKQFERSIRFAIDSQTKELVATNQQLFERGIEVLSEDLDHGFTMLSQDLASLETAIRDDLQGIVGTLNWGFGELLASMAQMNIQLADLVRLTQTPSQTWACEQFEIARDEFRRQLYPEALQSVTRAIDGFGSNPGIKTEFRFHFLVGTIKLGSYKNSSPEVINPQHAEQSFVAAARYAQADYPHEAGHALICAGRAALIQGALDRAIQHTRGGLASVPAHQEGMYQLARALFLNDCVGEATDRLVDAITLNVDFAVRASGDLDFISRRGFLRSALDQARNRYKAAYDQASEQFQRAEQFLNDFSFAGVQLRTFNLKGISDTATALASAQSAAASSTILGYHAALDSLSIGFSMFQDIFDAYKAQFCRHHSEQLSQRQEPTVRNRRFDFNGSVGLSMLATFVTFVGMSCSRCSVRVNSLVDVFYVFVPVLEVAIAVGGGLMGLRYAFHRMAYAEDAKRLAEYRAWKDSLQAEMVTIRDYHLPKDCEMPSLFGTAAEPK